MSDRERTFAQTVPAQQRSFFAATGDRNAMFTRSLRNESRAAISNFQASPDFIPQPGNTFNTRVRSDIGGPLQLPD